MINLSCNIAPKDKSFIALTKNEGIHAAFYNSNGSKIAMATTNGRLLLCNGDLKILKSIQAHDQVANSSFFSLNDSMVITGGSDQKIKCWNADDLSMVKTYPFIVNSHTTVLGNQTMVGCGEGGKVVIYYNDFGDTTTVFLGETAFHVFYNRPDTSVLVSSGNAGYEINLWQKKVTRKYAIGNGKVFCIMPDQNNTKVVIASSDSVVRVFGRETQKVLYQSKKLDGAVYVACYNYKNNTIAASTSSGSIYFFDTELSQIKKQIKAFKGCVNTIHYHPSDSFLVVGSLDKKGGGAKLFSVYSGQEIKKLMSN
jgi:WD40 repeat protein